MPEKKRTWRWTGFLKWIAGIYLAGGIALYFGQELLLFHPVSLPPGHTFRFDVPFREENIALGDRNLSFVKFPAAHKKGLVLFFHGNMRNVEHYAKYPALFTANGYEVWMVDYPGFGKTTGKRTEALLYADALTIYNIALKEGNGKNLVIYGKSMGTGVASWLAAGHPSKKLILETPYRSIPELALHFFPVYPSFLVRYKLPVHEYVKKVTVPVTIFHGTGDEVIPYSHATTLKKENASAELVTIEGGKHNNLSSYPLFRRKLDAALAY